MQTPNKKVVAGGLGTAVAGILAAVFLMEGGYVNNPADPGGETNHGITKAVAVSHGYIGSMKDLPKHYAEEIYLNEYIIKPGFYPLVGIKTAVAHKLIDAGVNTGTSRSSRWFQESLNQMSRGGKDYPQIKVDGKVGPATVNTYIALERIRGHVKACQLILKMVDAKQATLYASLPTSDVFLVGWIDHRISNVPLSDCER